MYTLHCTHTFTDNLNILYKFEVTSGCLEEACPVGVVAPPPVGVEATEDNSSNSETE